MSTARPPPAISAPPKIYRCPRLRYRSSVTTVVTRTPMVPVTGRGEGQEPVSAGGEVDIQQIQPDGHKVRRDEDHRVGPSEPQGQHRQDVQQRHAACGVPGPQDGPVDALSRCRSRWAAPPAWSGINSTPERFTSSGWPMGSGGKGGSPLLPGHIRVKHPGPAQGTHGFAVGQLHAAIDAIHIGHSFPLSPAPAVALHLHRQTSRCRTR